MERLVITRGGTQKVKMSREEIAAREEEEKRCREEEAAQAYIHKRNEERKSIAFQLEFIAENGIEEWMKREYEIRARHPKPGQKKPNMNTPNT